MLCGKLYLSVIKIQENYKEKFYGLDTDVMLKDNNPDNENFHKENPKLNHTRLGFSFFINIWIIYPNIITSSAPITLSHKKEITSAL